MTPAEERTLIRLLAHHPTPTEVVRKALRADACEIRLTCRGRGIVIRDVKWRPTKSARKDDE